MKEWGYLCFYSTEYPWLLFATLRCGSLMFTWLLTLFSYCWSWEAVSSSWMRLWKPDRCLLLIGGWLTPLRGVLLTNLSLSMRTAERLLEHKAYIQTWGRNQCRPRAMRCARRDVSWRPLASQSISQSVFIHSQRHCMCVFKISFLLSQKYHTK